MDGRRITWRDFQIDIDDLRIYKQDGKTPVTLRNSSALLYQLSVEILLKLLANSGEPVYAHDIDDWKRMDLKSKNHNLTSHISILKLALGLSGDEFEEEVLPLKRRRGSGDEIGYKFVGKVRGDTLALQRYRKVGPEQAPRMDEATVLAIAADLGIEGPGFLNEVVRYRDEPTRQSDLQKLRAAKQKIRRENINTELLKRVYSDEELAKEGLARYSVMIDGDLVVTNIVAAKMGLEMKVDLERAPDHGYYTFAGASNLIPKFTESDLAEFVANVWLTGTQAVNDPVLCLQSFTSSDPSHPMSFSMARYFDFRLSCGGLDDEIARALLATQYNVGEVVAQRDKLLPLRQTLLRNAAAITQCATRLCVGGINVVFALRRVNYSEGIDDFVFFLAERSDTTVAFAQGEQSVIPSGFHTTLVEKPSVGWMSPWQSVYRELGEELYQRQEATSQEGKIEFDPRGADCPPLHWFKGREEKVINDVLAFGFDLIDGSYQFSILLAVQDPSFWDENGTKAKLNYEYKHPGRTAIAISTMDRDGIAKILRNPMCAHTSVFALIPALQRLHEAEPSRVNLPPIELMSKWRTANSL